MRSVLWYSVLWNNCVKPNMNIGLNGCGKSTLMKVIAERQIPIPKQIDIYHLDRY
jgi:ATP-binding cassette subfamily F protein 2